MIMLPALAIITNIVGIMGGYMVSVLLLGTNAKSYLRATWSFVQVQDIYSGLIKACFFGAVFTLISCYKGFYAKGGAEGVGRATTGAVVYSSMTILISDYFLSAWMFR
jgi:phospholipid/cholesterol/gamma-HCH transport system permease protein